MSNTGYSVTCQQCERTETFTAADGDPRPALDAAGWAPYGTGITPLAEELAGRRGEFSCPSCTNELTDGRLNRIGADVMRELGLSDPWLVIRTADSATDYFRVVRANGAIQVEFEQYRTDRETRDALRQQLIAAMKQAR